jgi:cysteinyl-tRNA synthetase
MHNIKVFNTLANKLEPLITHKPNSIKFYVCGPTVYDRPHLGNARSIVVYDLFYRLFLQCFSEVIYVRNITDVDDKINNSAKEQNISILQLTSKVLEWFYHDINALQVLKPTHEPKVTNHIAEIITLIQKILANNHAYISQNHILFSVDSYLPYGQLSKRNTSQLIAGSRIEVENYKKNPLDFVLWKPASQNDDPSSVFDSPWGRGRPGWHIECSAMSSKYLGDNFDFHGGGADLQFPHHENEIAQSCCANKGSTYARYWVHNGFLTVNGEKMSKSLKNFITVFDLLQKNITGVVIRYMLLATHYRKPFDFNEKALQDAQKSIDKFYQHILDCDFSLPFLPPSAQLLQALSNDLNTSTAFAFLHSLVKEFDQKWQLASDLHFLGLLDINYLTKNHQQNNAIHTNEIEQMILLRQEYKQNKQFALADKIRDDLLKKGIIIADNQQNTTWSFIKK